MTNNVIFNEENLLKNGYKKFQSGFHENKNPDTYICSFQKRISDDIGKKYFITLHYNEWFHDGKDMSYYSFDCQFRTKEGTYVDVHIHYDNELTIKYTEEFYEKMWNAMEFMYYEKWSE